MTDSKNRALGHEHSFLGSSHDENARRTRSVVALTFIMMVGEIVAGYGTGSMALLADGFHMATHAGALGIAVLAYGYAKRNADNRAYSFGTGFRPYSLSSGKLLDRANGRSWPITVRRCTGRVSRD